MVNTYHCALKYYRRKSVPIQFVKKSFWWTAFTSCACGILFVHFPSSQGSWSVSTPLNNLHRDLTFGHSCLLLVANTFTDLLHLEKQGACWRCQKSILTTDKFEGKKKTKQTSQVSPKEERCTKKLFSPRLVGILRQQKKENQKETRSKRHLTDSTLTTGAVVFKQTSPIFHRAGPLENSSDSEHLFRFTNLVPPFWLKQTPSYPQNHWNDKIKHNLCRTISVLWEHSLQQCRSLWQHSLRCPPLSLCHTGTGSPAWNW